MLSLAQSCRCMFMECTRNALGLRGRRRVLCIDNCALTAEGGQAAGDCGAWDTLAVAEVVIGDELMLSLTEYFRYLLQVPLLRSLRITLSQRDYFFWLLNLTLIVNDFRNSTGKKKLEQLSIDFGADCYSDISAPAPVVNDLFETLQQCDSLKSLELVSAPLSSDIRFRLPPRLEQLSLHRWFAVDLVRDDLTRLHRLCISSSSIDDEQATALFSGRNWQMLHSLELPDNLITSMTCLFGSRLPCLRKIDLSNNTLSEDFESVIDLLQRLPQIDELSIASNMIGEEGLMMLLRFCDTSNRTHPLVIDVKHNGIRIAAQIGATGRNIPLFKILFE